MHSHAPHAPGALARRLMERRMPPTRRDAEWLLSFFEYKYAPLEVRGGAHLFEACIDDAETAILYAVGEGRGLAYVWSLLTVKDGSTWLVSGIHPELAHGYLVTSLPWRFDTLAWLPVETPVGWES